ncbi:uncharacterized protein LOC122522508 [Polistes fuscatus]|uniref:uncharacterized protein LOC122522508 n=1 Tax=Polistes fuscatus TaxID=30207 RepID=UPI001CA8BE4A|nr:uncharacterized protein LOC122522508 [Polistes fuscatus]
MEMIAITTDPANVFPLVLDSINEKATYICIKLNKIKRHIQIIDNGIGLYVPSFPDLNDNKLANNIQDLSFFIRLRHHNLKVAFKQFYRIFLTSKCTSFKNTYTKIFEKEIIMLRDEIDRPMNGTTLTLYDYIMSPESNKKIMHLICFLIANVSLNNPQVIN